MPAVPQPGASAKPGVYMVNKPDVNQGRVSIGHLGVKRPLPDEFALAVANDILGGGGFTAWMMSRVRSDEGLAYSAYSNYSIGDLYPGDFRAYFQSKSSTCAQAAKLTIDLMNKMRAGEVTEKELVTSKNSFTETLPRVFESKLRTVTRFAQDELVGRPHEYWTTYRQRVGAVTVPEVGKARQGPHQDRPAHHPGRRQRGRDPQGASGPPGGEVREARARSCACRCAIRSRSSRSPS